MNQNDGPAWVRVCSVDAIAEQYWRDLAAARAEAHKMIDDQFDRRAAEQALLLEQWRRDLEGAPQH